MGTSPPNFGDERYKRMWSVFGQSSDSLDGLHSQAKEIWRWCQAAGGRFLLYTVRDIEAQLLMGNLHADVAALVVTDRSPMMAASACPASIDPLHQRYWDSVGGLSNINSTMDEAQNINGEFPGFGSMSGRERQNCHNNAGDIPAFASPSNQEQSFMRSNGGDTCAFWRGLGVSLWPGFGTPLPSQGMGGTSVTNDPFPYRPRPNVASLAPVDMVSSTENHRRTFEELCAAIQAGGSEMAVSFIQSCPRLAYMRQNNATGGFAIHLAAAHGRLEVVAALLRLPGTLEQMDLQGLLAIDVAQSRLNVCKTISGLHSQQRDAGWVIHLLESASRQNGLVGSSGAANTEKPATGPPNAMQFRPVTPCPRNPRREGRRCTPDNGKSSSNGPAGGAEETTDMRSKACMLNRRNRFPRGNAHTLSGPPQVPKPAAPPTAGIHGLFSTRVDPTRSAMGRETIPNNPNSSTAARNRHAKEGALPSDKAAASNTAGGKAGPVLESVEMNANVDAGNEPDLLEGYVHIPADRDVPGGFVYIASERDDGAGTQGAGRGGAQKWQAVWGWVKRGARPPQGKK